MDLSFFEGNELTRCLLIDPIPNVKIEVNEDGFGRINGFHEAEQRFSGPKKSELTDNWFSRINIEDDIGKLLCFPESCLILSKEGNESIGKMYMSIEQTKIDGKSCFLVHSASFATISENVIVGTNLIGFVTPQLRVIQELSHEWAKINGQQIFDKKILLIEDGDLLGNSLLCRTQLQIGNQLMKDHLSSIPFIELNEFISEATNIIFQRLLILEKKTGKIYARTIGCDGNTIPIRYEFLGKGKEEVKGEIIDVYGIRRSTIDENSKQKQLSKENWDTMFNYYGRVMLRCKSYEIPRNHTNEYALVTHWFRTIEEIDGHKPMRIQSHIPWTCDYEFFSTYLNKKDEFKFEHKTFLMDNPSFITLLKDFIQHVLFEQPIELINYAKDYFKPMLKIRQESGIYSDSDESTSCEEDEQ